jgi:hydroxyacylglutathione hydrolase
MSEPTTITLDNANCYLFRSGRGFVLVDSAFPRSRAALLSRLEAAECRPGDLRLIVLTHGDIDHSGNASYLRSTYGARIAMHAGDTAQCASDGVTRPRDTRVPDDFPKVLYLWFVVAILKYLWMKLMRSDRFEPFAPDVLLEDGQDLAPLGLEAVAYHTPGHSKGSVCLLTPEGGLYCGDEFGQVWGRVISSRDDPDFPSTTAKLRALNVRTVYPGHGHAFASSRTGLWPASTN